MAKVHGSWGHYVRPGRSDPVYNGSWWRYNDDGSERSKGHGESPSEGRPPHAAFIVYGANGKVLYHCGKGKAANAKERVKRMLPSGSYTSRAGVIRLRRDLSSLGYSSASEFASCCAGKQVEPKGSRGACVGEDEQTPTKSEHLDGREQRILERMYRAHGGDQGWKGWDTLLPGRSKSFLFREVKRLGIDKPDDKTWTRVETRIFQKHWKDLREDSLEWRSLLPRKSSAGIAHGYRQGGFEQSGAEAQADTRPGGKRRGRRRRKSQHRIEDDAL